MLKLGKFFSGCKISSTRIQKFATRLQVELDKELEDKLVGDEIKPRHHFGINKSNSIVLPKHIVKSISKVAGDYPQKTLHIDGIALNRYIQCRKLPSEESTIKDKIQQIENQIDTDPAKFNLSKPPHQNDREAIKNYKEKRQQKVQHILKQRLYAWQPQNYDFYTSLTYLFGRSAQEYAVLLKIFREIDKRHPDFKPRSFFDFGSGVGTGTWAVSQIWEKYLFEYYMVDASRHMVELSDLILRFGDSNKDKWLKNVYHRQFLPSRDDKYDVVLSAFSLLELPTLKNRLEVLTNLWNKTSNYLVLVEHGSNAGFQVINEARQFLFSLNNMTGQNEDAHIFAPCPHESPCPRVELNDGTPCNFEISFHSLPVGETTQIRKDLYSYLVIKKGEKSKDSSWPRVVRPTLVRSKHSICRMCTKEGKLEEIIFTASKQGKLNYRCARASKWGDRLPMNLSEKEIQDIEKENNVLEK